MSLISTPQYDLAVQKRQFGQFSSETNQVKANDVLQCLAHPEASGLTAETSTPAAQSAAQHAAYLAGTPQFLGVFTS